MSKIKYSALVSEMRNKLNGSVLSKNRYGNYIRNKVTPVNPQTSYQQAQRSLLGSLSSQWRGLTQVQIQAWRNAAANFPRTDIFGDQIILTGQALFVALNKNLVNAGQAQITDAPAPAEIPALALTAITASSIAGTDTLTVTIDPAAIPAGFSLMVYATPSVGAGINFVKNLYRFLGTFTVTAGVATLSTVYTARFGAMTATQKVYVKAALVNNDNGQMGIPVEISDIIAAA